VVKMISEGKIKADAGNEFRAILQARYGKHKDELRFLSGARNLTYASLLGNPINALSNIQSLAWSLFESPIQTIPAFVKTIVRQNKTKLKDIGIETIAQEMSDKNKLAKFTRRVLKAGGFQLLDTISKETLIETVLRKYQKIAKADSEKLPFELMEIFDGEEEIVINVLKDLKRGYVSDDIKYLAYNKLSEYEPISKLEVPETYLTNPNIRVFYMLKTYTLKQFDVYRNKVWNEFKTDPKQAMKNMVGLSAALLVMGVTADELKNYLMGREVSFRDEVINNAYKLAGFSRYIPQDIKRTGLLKAVFSEQLLPPTNVFDDLYRDITNELTDPTQDIDEWRSLKNIPVGGKLYYWWFGKGKEYTIREETSMLPEKIFKEMKKVDTKEEREAILLSYKDSGQLTDEFGELDKNILNKLKGLIKDEKLGMTDKEKKLRNADTEEIAEYLYNQGKKMTIEERQVFLKDMKDKGILTETVAKQLILLIK